MSVNLFYLPFLSFAIGVWSSMSKKVGKPIVDSVFQGIELAFRLFQNHCETIESTEATVQEENDTDIFPQSGSSCSAEVKHEKNLHYSRKISNLVVTEVKVENARKNHSVGEKPLFLKNLCHSFKIYPQWNFTNTVHKIFPYTYTLLLILTM